MTLGHFTSRSKARRHILEGKVYVDGIVQTKPATLFSPKLSVEIKAKESYVGRGGLKLEEALDHFRVPVDGKVCLDVGASTGGFTHCLLQRNAAQVYAVDVGRGQLHPSLQEDSRVVSQEGINARELCSEMFPCRFELIVIDVSFISLSLVLSPVIDLAAEACYLICLVKPQFEVGKSKVGSGGVVREESSRQLAVSKIDDTLKAMNEWRRIGVMPCSVVGADGNQEYFICAER